MYIFLLAKGSPNFKLARSCFPQQERSYYVEEPSMISETSSPSSAFTNTAISCRAQRS